MRAGAEAEGAVLQRALAALVADRAVERVVLEQELQHAVLAVAGGVGVRAHDHVRLHGGAAGGLQAAHALHLDQAHAAGADGRAQARLVAEDRHLDAVGVGGVDQHRPGRRGHAAAVQLELDLLGGREVDRARSQPPTATSIIGSGRGSPPFSMARTKSSRKRRTALTHREDPGVGQGAEHPAADAPGERLDQLQVLHPALAVDDPLQDPLQPERPLAAGRALAARLVAVEVGEAQGGAHDRAGVVHHDASGRAERGAGGGQRLVVERACRGPRGPPRSRSTRRPRRRRSRGPGGTRRPCRRPARAAWCRP